jgi:hypothetical protein
MTSTAHTPTGTAPFGCGPGLLWLQNGRAVPMAGEQRQLDVEPIAADLPAAPRDGATHPILHRVEMQVEFLEAATL